MDWPEDSVVDLYNKIIEASVDVGSHTLLFAAGSRVFGGFREKSDLDIAYYTDGVKTHSKKDNKSFVFQNIRVSIKYFPSNLAILKVRGKWLLPLFNLTTHEYLEGNSGDLEKYKQHRQKIRDSLSEHCKKDKTT